MAKNTLLINVDIGETRVGLIADGVLRELYVERRHHRSPVGNIYLARARTDLMLLWGLISGALLVTAFVVGLQWGTVGVARAYALASGLLLAPGLIWPLRLIETPMRDLLAALWRPALAALLMGLVVAGAGVLLRDRVTLLPVSLDDFEPASDAPGFDVVILSWVL